MKNQVLVGNCETEVTCKAIRAEIKDQNLTRGEVVKVVSRLRSLNTPKATAVAASLAGEWGV